nr:polynucleotide adenylyltransferase PcnB [Motiliproteus sp. SC1-56]
MTTAPQGRTVIHRDDHILSRRDMSDNALKVLYRLKDAGYEAYLVGGCVRDLLLGEHPKDFDVATEATPEEVHELFRNSRLIGRRFKLVHVRFGREIIEVATFRAGHDSQNNAQHGHQDDSGRILRDNVYGTVEEDALRRDFTVNALYYSVRDFSIHDHANGVEDLDNRTLRLIGDPEARYREDPVRMLRAVRFAAKLGFTMAEETEEPICRLAPLLGDIPAARLFEEVLKLLLGGRGEETFKLLREFNLFTPLFPATQRLLERGGDQAELCEELIIAALRNTDKRIKKGKSVTPAFIYAAMLWHPLQVRIAQLRDEGLPPIPALHQAAQDVVQQQVQATSIPRRFSGPMREIWELQFRLPRRFGRRAEQLVEHPRFRAAYDFLLMREASGEQLDQLGDWWTRYQEEDDEGRAALVKDLGGQRPKRKRKRSRKPRSADNG